MSVREELGGPAARTRDTDAFNPVVVLAAVLVGVVAFAAAVVLTGWSDQLQPTSDGRAHALSPGGTGFSGLVRLLEDVGVDAGVTRHEDLRRDTTLKPGGSALRVVTLSRPARASGLEEVLDSDTLLVLPKWRAARIEDGAPRGWVQTPPAPNRTFDVESIGDGLDRNGGSLALARLSGARELVGTDGSGIGLGTTRIVKAQVLDGEWMDASLIGEEEPGDRPVIGPDLLIEGKPAFFSVHDESGRLLYHVLTEPDLLNNQGLATRSRALIATEIIDHARSAAGSSDAAVRFDLSVHGFGAGGGLIQALTRPPLLGATLCAVAAALLLGWLAWMRWGDPVRVEDGLDTGKATLIGNGARLVAQAGRSLSLAAPYAALHRRRTLKSLRVEGATPERVEQALRGLEERLARVGDGASFREAEAALHNAGTESELVEAARMLHDTAEKAEG